MRIAHLTDLHLRRSIPGPLVQTPRRGHEVVELLPRALAEIRERGADLVVLTGDLVDVPLYLFEAEREQAADHAAWAAVREDYRWLRRTLDDSQLRWIAIPGNHDSYRLTRSELTSGPLIEDVEGVRIVSFWDREHAHNVPRRILAERRRFEAAVTDPDPTPQVHLQHFVITPKRNDGYPATYLEAAELVARLANAPHATLALSGHHHEGAEPEQHGNAVFSITPAFTEAPHPYRMWNLTPDPASDGGVRITWEQIELGGPTPRPAVFLDRDGCINTLPVHHAGPEAMELLPGAASAIRRLRAAGYAVVVVTNQTAVGLGHVTPFVVAEVNDRMHALLAAEGARVDAVEMTFQAGDAAVAETYRTIAPDPKPSPEMLTRAASTLRLDPTRSFMVGDRLTDVEAGRRAGVSPILVRTGAGRASEQSITDDSVLVVDDLPAAVQAVLSAHTAR